ncbi:hypothetical protein NA57DRAFT_68186 [Rhizodiscina lignyota]|uniref:Right handed beta helix domain-containing protein n=1 Tax=Rhizodiscina lignyota TaxID=1504668 RepID=A0A9P4IA68_9PEZI|nr:hypothetical protein NA57DRAFT_68186 [Rhizodiscina lignyota]
MHFLRKQVLPLLAAAASASAACISSGDQTTINNAFSAGGQGAVVQLCANAVITITGSVTFTAADQELSTEGYPTDDSRATLIVAPGSSASNLVTGKLDGLRLRNVQLDGNRPNAGWTGGDANVEMGGLSNGQIIDHVVTRNPRGWSCLHVIGSGDNSNPCRNVTVTNNESGPCGQSGTDANGNGLWADGLSIDCTDTLVQSNTVNGSTDGGIVIFGSPGTVVTENTIYGSEEYLGFGAINMVDDEYSGSYSGVQVTKNTIIGGKMFNLGIGIGAYIWSFNDPSFLSGPATIEDNTISGNVAFPIALNGWEDGITISGNDVSGVTTPRSSFADASSCSTEIQNLFNDNDALVYYPAGVSGTANLQSGFVAASSNITNFLCTSTPKPSSVSFAAGDLSVTPEKGSQFAVLSEGVIMQYQGDSNIVVLKSNAVQWASDHTVSSCGSGAQDQCKLTFSSDGTLASFFGSTEEFSTGTSGSGYTMVCINTAPWIQIKDSSGSVVWDTTKAT